jgi:MFS transporter, DHA3 family, macrolide efflux protein
MPEKVDGWRPQMCKFRNDIVDGLRYVWRKGGLRELVLVSAMLNFFTAPILLLLPFYVEDFLKVAVDWYGFIIAAYGIGALLGYLAAGIIKTSNSARATLMIVLILLEAVGYSLLAFVKDPYTALALSVLGGFAGGYVTVNITTLLQFTTPGPIRGRVFGLLGTIAGAITPIAMGISGVIADLLDQNIPLIYFACGVIMAALTLLLALSKEFRDYLASEMAPEAAMESMEPSLPLQ